MLQWYCIGPKWAIHLGTKTSRHVIIVANWATLHGFATREIRTTKRMLTRKDDDYTFAIQHRTQLKVMCKWIMDLEATKYISFHRASFDTNEVIAPHNVFWIR